MGAACVAALLAGRAAALDAARAPTQYVHQRYDARDGLPQNLVRALAQTPDGYLWVASDEGLTRFDGARFTVLDRRSQPAMKTDLLTALVPDGAGGLLVGTADQGVLRVSEGEVGAPWSAGGASDPAAGASALARDPGGDVWVGTFDRGLLQVSGGRVVAAYGASQGLPCDEVLAVHAVAAGDVWVGTQCGPARVRGGVVEPGPAELSSVPVRGVASDGAGDLWFATGGRGLARLHGAELRRYGRAEGLPSDHARAVLCGRDGSVWVGTPSGLGRVSEGRAFSLAPIVPERVQAILEDAEGALWVGTQLGLHRLRDGDFVTYGSAEGVPGQNVYNVVQTPDGTVWLGTSEGLSHTTQGEWFAPALVRGEPLGLVSALHVDGRGSLWVSTLGEAGPGLWLSEWRGGRVVRSWPRPPRWPSIFSIASGPDGTVWLGTIDGVLRLRGGELEPVPGLPPRTRVNVISLDAAGVPWVGTERRWVYRLAGDRFAPAPGEGPPRQRKVVNLRHEPDGTLWAMTVGSGLWRLRDGRWAGLDRRDGLFDDVAWAMLDDGQGRLWFSSNRGVWRVERREIEERLAGLRAAPVTSVVYGEADGMRSRECNGGATPGGLRSRDGRLWFPTTDGVAVVDPARLRPRPAPVPALLEAVRLDGRELRAHGTLELPAGAARLELGYTGVTLVEPEHLRFRYRLEGYDPGWIEAGPARLATYTRLPPGRYRFEVEAGTLAEGFGPRATLAIVQRPRLYQTWWFYALAGTGLALLAMGAHLVRTWRLRTRERELERRVKEALAEVKTLSGLIPICAWCKKIRDDQGYWQRLESYLGQRSQAQFSHGMCPECFKRNAAAAGLASTDAPEVAPEVVPAPREGGEAS